MGDLPHHQHGPLGPANGEEQTGDLTRRNVLVGVAATTMAATVAGIDTPANARSMDPDSPEDMVLFVLLSSALTGISEAKLAPGFNSKKKMTADEFQQFMKQLKLSDLTELNPGSDPVDIKRDYFNWVYARDSGTFEYLLRIAEQSLGTPDRKKAIIERVQFADDAKKSQPEIDAKFLARSIVLMWYLGGWYDPQALQKSTRDASVPLTITVISPKAYTQGWALRVAQAHPMGFSQMQFGYWNVIPDKRSDFTG
jgi:hypothetical protein